MSEAAPVPLGREGGPPSRSSHVAPDMGGNWVHIGWQCQYHRSQCLLIHLVLKPYVLFWVV